MKLKELRPGDKFRPKYDNTELFMMTDGGAFSLKDGRRYAGHFNLELELVTFQASDHWRLVRFLSQDTLIIGRQMGERQYSCFEVFPINCFFADSNQIEVIGGNHEEEQAKSDMLIVEVQNRIQQASQILQTLQMMRKADIQTLKIT